MADEAMLDLVRQHMRDVRVPGHHDKVYKDECMFSFDSPLSPGGLFLNLATWQAFSERYLPLDAERSGGKLYLWQKWHKVPLSEEEAAAQKVKPEKMAIGGDGGFQVDAEKHKIEKESALVVMPGRQRVPLPCPELPEMVLNAINTVVAHDSASKQEEVAVWEEERRESKYARDLAQLPAERKVPADPSKWKCDDTGVTENLWLNLSTGHIGSGRQQWGGTGGSGAALQHFQDTGSKYPLVVKLGTITPHGADVYSYAPDEDDMVTDPLLGDHLAHWGINMLQMSKTEKTMAELEIDQNVKFEWDKITEAGAELQPLSGPGYVGLTNLGNSCYMNSVLQVLWTVPSMRARYVDRAEDIFRSAPTNPADDFASQMAKVGRALVTGDTGAQVEEAGPGGAAAPPEDSAAAASAAVTGGTGGQEAVKPQFFKALASKGHQEFSSGRQQDALEYFQHLLEVMTRAERAAGSRLGNAEGATGLSADVFAFQLEDRKQDVETRRVRYRRYVEGPPLSFSIPLDAATNKGELEDYKDRERKRQKLADASADAYIGADLTNGGAANVVSPAAEEPVKPQVPFAACVDKWAAQELLEGVAGAGGAKRSVLRQTRFATFPPYLLVQMRRYYTGEGWVPKKMDVLVEAPDSLDLEHLRAKGLQPGEEEDPDVDDTPSTGGQHATAAAATAPAAIEPDPAIVAQLMSMGFGENGSKRAAIATQNAGTEVSTEWVLAHMEDADFNDPLPEPAAAGSAPTAEADSGADAESVALLSSMGFTDAQAAAALKACSGSVERAADWLFSHADDLDGAVAALSSATASAPASGAADSAALERLNDGPGKYSVVGFISHMGANTACGHYVAHIRKEGRWVIYNDEKVAASAKPPKDLGYLYLYRRNDVKDS